MGEAVRRVCAMGFPESEARFAFEAQSTYEEAVAFMLDDGDAVGVALTANHVGAGTALLRPSASPTTGDTCTATESGSGEDNGAGVIGMAPLLPGVPSAPPVDPDSVLATDVPGPAEATSDGWNWRRIYFIPHPYNTVH